MTASDRCRTIERPEQEESMLRTARARAGLPVDLRVFTQLRPEPGRRPAPPQWARCHWPRTGSPGWWRRSTGAGRTSGRTGDTLGWGEREPVDRHRRLVRRPEPGRRGNPDVDAR